MSAHRVSELELYHWTHNTISSTKRYSEQNLCLQVNDQPSLHSTLEVVLPFFILLPSHPKDKLGHTLDVHKGLKEHIFTTLLSSKNKCFFCARFHKERSLKIFGLPNTYSTVSLSIQINKFQNQSSLAHSCGKCMDRRHTPYMRKSIKSPPSRLCASSTNCTSWTFNSCHLMLLVLEGIYYCNIPVPISNQLPSLHLDIIV